MSRVVNLPDYNLGDSTIKTDAFTVMLLLCILVVFSLFSRDIYAPSLPSIGASLSAGKQPAQVVFLACILSIGLSQVFYGPLSDRYGRKNIVSTGLLLIIFGNALSFLSKSIHELTAAQCIVGVGIGACSSIPRAIASDLFSGSSLTKSISFMSMATTVPSMLAPLIGGFIQEHLTWRYNFLFADIMAIIALLFMLFIPEVYKPKIEKFSLSFIFEKYQNCLLKTDVLLYSVVASIVYGSIVIYQIVTPFIFQDYLGITPAKNGVILLISAVSYLGGSFFVIKTSHLLLENKLLRNIIILAATGSILYLIGQTNSTFMLYVIIAAFMLNNFCCGVITPIIYKRALEQSASERGTTSGLFNMVRMTLTFLISVIGLWVVSMYGYYLLPIFVSMLWFSLIVIHLKYVNQDGESIENISHFKK